MNEHESLTKQLEKIAQNSQPDTQFVDSLENELRTAHLEMQSEKGGKLIMFKQFFSQSDNKTKKRKRKPAYSMRWLAAILALVLIGGLFLTVPPLRNTAVSVMDSFYPPEIKFFYPTYDETFGAEKTEPFRGIRFYKTETLEQASAIYRQDILVLPEQEGVAISQVSANPEGLILTYHIGSSHELGSGYPSVISLYQLYLPDGLPIPMAAPAQDFNQKIVRVNGVPAAYLQSGIWNLYMPSFWSTGLQNSSSYISIGNAHRLAWQDGDIVYVLTMTEYLADSVDDVVAVAESLVPYKK